MADTSHIASEKEARDVAESARETEWEHPSFVRELFLGRFRLDLIHPHPAVDDPAEAARAKPFIDELRAFLERFPSEEIDRTGEIPESLVQELRDMGAFGIKIPKEYGGLGLSQLSLHPRDGDGHVEGRIARRAAVREPVDRRSAAAQAVRHRRAEAKVFPATREGRDLGVRADRGRRRVRSRRT